MNDYSNFHKCIPEFSGTTKDVNRFIACCDNFYSSLTDDNNRNIFLKSLVRKFTDRAFDFYNRNEWTSWDLLKTSLKKYFSSPKTFEGYQIELGKIRQGSFSVREFSEKIEFILTELKKISDEIIVNDLSGAVFFNAQNEKLAIKAFVDGLNDPLKTILSA